VEEEGGMLMETTPTQEITTKDSNNAPIDNKDMLRSSSLK